MEDTHWRGNSAGRISDTGVGMWRLRSQEVFLIIIYLL
jgi:hypothetical protein